MGVAVKGCQNLKRTEASRTDTHRGSVMAECRPRESAVIVHICNIALSGRVPIPTPVDV